MKKIKIVDYLGQQEARAMGVTYKQYLAGLKQQEMRATLNKLTAEMKAAHRALDKAKKSDRAVVFACCDLLTEVEDNFGAIPTLISEVPVKVRKMFGDLHYRLLAPSHFAAIS